MVKESESEGNKPCKGNTLLACLMWCNKSWHLPGNPKLVLHPTCLINKGGFVDLLIDTMHLKDPLIIVGSDGPALPTPLFHLSSKINMLCHCSFTMVKHHALVIFYDTKWLLCADVPSMQAAYTHSFTGENHHYTQINGNRKHSLTLCSLTRGDWHLKSQ